MKHIFEVIDQTRGRVFTPISKHREVGWKNEAREGLSDRQHLAR